MAILEYEPGVKEALEKVHALGMQDGKEHIIALDSTGLQIMQVDGTDHNVHIDNDEHQGLVYVHNHPSSLNSLSDADLLYGHAHAAKAIYAITHDKSVYKAHSFVGGGNVLNTHLLSLLWLGLWMDFKVRATGRLSDRLVDELMEGGSEWLNEAHWINIKLSQETKSKPFVYEYELSPDSQALISKVDGELGNGSK